MTPTEASGAVVGERDAFLAGVRAGLEAAARTVDEADYETTSFAGMTYDDGPRTLGAAARAIRAIDPASVSPAGALREEGTI